MRGRSTLAKRVVAWIGEVVAVGIPTIAVRQSFCNGVIGIDDPHGRGVGHRRHARFLPLLLVSVDDEQRQQEEHNKDKDDNACDGSDLIGVGRKGGAGPA